MTISYLVGAIDFADVLEEYGDHLGKKPALTVTDDDNILQIDLGRFRV